MNNDFEEVEINNDSAYLLFLDLETTGLDYRTDKIIEIGACFVSYNFKTNEYKLLSTFNSLVNINAEISSKIIELTNITQVDIDNAENKIKVQETWANWLENKTKGIDEVFIIGHSVEDFDLKFIKEEGYYLPLKYKVIDTNVLAKTLLPFQSAQNLEYLSNHYNIQFDLDIKGISHHRALYDTYINYQVFKNLISSFGELNLTNSLRQNIIKFNLNHFPLHYFDLTWNSKTINKFDIKQAVKTSKYYNFHNSYPQDQYSLINYFKVLLNNQNDLLDSFFEYYFQIGIKNKSINIGIIQLCFIYEFLRYNKNTKKLSKLSINPYIQSKLYTILYSFCTGKTIPNLFPISDKIIFENIINDYDYISSKVIKLNVISDSLQVLAMINGNVDYQSFYNQIIVFKSEFEKNANYGIIYLTKSMINSDIKTSVFEQSYFKFINFVFELINNLPEFDNEIYNSLKNSLISYIDSVDQNILPIFKVNGGFVDLYFKQEFSLESFYNSKTIFTYLNEDELLDFQKTLDIQKIQNINQISGLEDVLNEVSILDPRLDLDNYLDIINSDNISNSLIVLNSYKIYKELESKLKNIGNSKELFDKDVFVCGSMGSFTKGVSKLKSAKVEILVIFLKNYQAFASSGIIVKKEYFIGNTALNYSPIWPFKKGFNNIRQQLLKSYILSSKDL